ncbi:VQ motif-containing protein 4 [Argentina anserina]|uniref:VQ motif-containing protein 4 n=1 Tax=Argentina anserina TaxID=57926 RepID=UPI0021762A6E|nr:VQ motif-containing protein 4 [Potentilla anserina]
MEYTSRTQEPIRDYHHHHQKPPPSYSPLNSPTSNGSSNNNNNNNSGVQTPTTPKLTPRSESNPYATTFVQADSSNFKHVVQMLTGSSETTTKQLQQTNKHTQESSSSSSPLSSSSKNFTIPPVKTGQKKQQSFKLYERRSQNLKNSLMINTLMPNFAHHRSQASSGFSPRHPKEILSPSLLDFPSLTLSPITPLNDEHFDKSASASSPLGNSSEEDRAIAEKGFYLHPSPRTSSDTPREPEPRLLPLFPVTSPRVSGSSAS